MEQTETVALMAATIYATRAPKALKLPDVNVMDATAKEAWQLYYAVKHASGEASRKAQEGRPPVKAW